MKKLSLNFLTRWIVPAIATIGMMDIVGPVESASAQRGGGRIGGGGGGGGGARPSMGGGGFGSRPMNMGGGGGGMASRPMNMGGGGGGGRMQMPQMPQSRPSFGNTGRPNFPQGGGANMGNMGRPAGFPGGGNNGMARPMPGNISGGGANLGGNRPSLGMGRPTTLPGNGISTGNIGARPNPGNLGNLNPGSRPNLQLPGGMPSTNRPGGNGLGGNGLGGNGLGGNGLGGNGLNRPAPQPGLGGGNRPTFGGANRPTTLPGNIGGGNLAGGNRPTTLPGNIGGGGTTKPAPLPGGGINRPGTGGDRPGIGGGNRPGIGGDRPTTLPGGINRPNPGDRPGIGGGNRPGIGGERPTTLPGEINRPGIGGGNRPGIGIDPPGPGINRPGIGGGNRPGIGGERPVTLPGVIDRPGGGGNWNGGNRPGGWNRPDWNGNGNGNGNGWGNWGGGNWGNNSNNWNRPGWNNNNNNVNINNNWNNNWHNNNFNRPAWDRPGYGGWGNSWGVGGGNWSNGWYNNCINPHYHGWYNGSWNNYWGSSWYSPLAWGAVGWGLGSVSNGFYNNSFAYANPYYATPIATVASSSIPYDYSQPVVVNNYITADSQSDGSTSTSTASPTNYASPVANATVQESFSDFDNGLASFKSGDYKAALDSLNNALRNNGGDPVIHEVRALTLFALGDYNSAALALNSLLASAPGMDWTSLSSLYLNTDDYTKQLRKLEEYCKANPKNPASAFVLAYHYLVIGSKESAIRALRVVVENQPKDLTAKRMLDALDPKPASAPEPAATNPTSTDASAPLPDVDLVGKWAANSGTTTIELGITEESTFTWKAIEGDKSAVELAGDFGTNGDAVMMQTKDQGSLGGNVKPISADEWRLIPPGAKDPNAGLTFKRVK